MESYFERSRGCRGVQTRSEDKEGPAFPGFQFPASGMRQWKLFEGLDKSPFLKGPWALGKRLYF